jgi:hypothetical protein
MFVCMVVLAALPMRLAAQTPAPPLNRDDQEAVKHVLAFFEREFALPAQLVLEPELRVAAEDMAKQHLARMPARAVQWLQAAKGNESLTLTRGEIESRVWARAFNEITHWRLAGAAEAADVAAQAHLLNPSICRFAGGNGWFANLMLQLQSLPAPRRAATLAAEESLLRRWGEWPAPPLPPRVSMAQLTQLAVERVKSGKARLDPPMPPVLAHLTLANEPKTPSSPDTHCVHRLWGLLAAFQQPAADREELMWSYRHAAAPDVNHWYSPTAPTDPEPEYPPIAARWGVEGTVTVEARVNSLGKALDFRVAARSLKVMGQPMERPFAFETLLDAASLVRVGKMQFGAPEASRLNNGVAVISTSFVWRLQ